MNSINTTIYTFQTKHQSLKYVYIRLTISFQIRAEFVTTSFQVRGIRILYYYLKHGQLINIEYSGLRTIFRKKLLYPAHTSIIHVDIFHNLHNLDYNRITVSTDKELQLHPTSEKLLPLR